MILLNTLTKFLTIRIGLLWTSIVDKSKCEYHFIDSCCSVNDLGCETIGNLIICVVLGACLATMLLDYFISHIINLYNEAEELKSFDKEMNDVVVTERKVANFEICSTQSKRVNKLHLGNESKNCW